MQKIDFFSRFHHFGYDKPESDCVAPPKSPQPPQPPHPPQVTNTNVESNMTAYSGGDECETNDQLTMTTTETTTAPCGDFMKGMAVSPQKSLKIRISNQPRAKSAPNLLLSVSQLITPPERSLVEHELRKISLNSHLKNYLRPPSMETNQRPSTPSNHIMRLLSFCKPLTSCCRTEKDSDCKETTVSHIKSGLSNKIIISTKMLKKINFLYKKKSLDCMIPHDIFCSTNS